MGMAGVLTAQLNVLRRMTEKSRCIQVQLSQRFGFDMIKLLVSDELGLIKGARPPYKSKRRRRFVEIRI